MDSPAAAHPEIRIPLDPLPSDNASPVRIRWSEDGNRLVIGSTVDLGPGAFWHVHGMDLSLAFGLAGVLWLAALARRILKRPQVPGRTYCRRCNYDVGDVAPGDACPECGIDLGGRAGRMPGRTRTAQAVRAWPWVLVATTMAAAGLGHFASRANGPSMALRTDTWPVAGLDRVSGAWPLRRPLPYRPAIGWRMDVWQVPPAGSPWPDAPEWSVLEERPWVIPDFTLAPDGARAAWLRMGTASTPSVLRVADLAARSSHEVTLSTATSGSFRMQGWTDRSSRLTVTFDTMTGVPGPDGNLVDSVVRARVLSVDCRAGAPDPVRALGDVRWNEPIDRPNVLTHRVLVAAVGDESDGGTASWALAALAKDAMSAGRLGAVDHCVVGRGGAVTELGTRACPDGRGRGQWDNRFWHDFAPSITAGGVFVATTRLSIRLEDGACVPSANVRLLSLDAVSTVAPPHEAVLQETFTAGGGIERTEPRGRIGGFGPLVTGLRGKAGVSSAEPWPHGLLEPPTSSRDGNLVAMALAPPPAVTAPGVPPAYNRAGTRYEVWVWRLPDSPRGRMEEQVNPP